MSAATTISVALCTHNGERFIERQLASILRQDRLPDEIVVSDDASTDATLHIVRGMAEQCAAAGTTLVVLENQRALGVTANFEQAMRACGGDLVVLCDQDDEWRRDRLSVAVAAFAARPGLLLLHSDARLVDAGGAPLGASLVEALGMTPWERDAIHGGRALDALLRRNLVTGATTVVRRELVELATPFPEPWVHDEWLAVLAAATGEIDLVEEPLIDYRQHGSNEIGVRRLGALGKVRRLLEPRDGRNDYLARRAHVLLARLEALGDAVRPDVLAKAAEKARHQDARAAIPRQRLRRILPVVAEARTGRYARFSRGNADILRDLLQAAGTG
jgi:glycosyltransferase involved in cell wall biosynthesis